MSSERERPADDAVLTTSGGEAWPIRLVRHPRARRYRLALDPAARELRLSVPPRAAPAPALAWARAQGAWLDGAVARVPAPRDVTPGVVLPIAGRPTRLLHAADAPRRARWAPGDGPGGGEAPDTLTIGGPRDGWEARIARAIAARALEVLSADSDHYARLLGRAVRSVAVADPRRRWGSCSSDGRLRYSWRLILAPPAVRRATAAHEVAHLAHMHHGPAFHAAVDALFEGDVDAARDWLRAHGATLHAWRFAPTDAPVSR